MFFVHFEKWPKVAKGECTFFRVISFFTASFFLDLTSRERILLVLFSFRGRRRGGDILDISPSSLSSPSLTTPGIRLVVLR